MENILLTGGISGFAQRVSKLFPDDRIVFADSRPIPSPLLKVGKYIAIPSPAKLSFVHELLKICLDHDITQLIPLREEELLPLAKSKLLFEEYGLVILLPTIEILQKIPKMTYPNHSNCAITVKNITDNASSGNGNNTLLGIYAVDEVDQPKLCCIGN